MTTLLESLAATCGAPSPAEATTLPPEAYGSQELFDLETERIFKAGWVPLCRVEQVAEPGSYYSIDILGLPLVVTRDRAGELHVLSRSCRHRWMDVCSGSGTTRALQCPYHLWTYGLDGHLAGTPEMGGSTGFDRADYNLRAYRHDVWQGFLFVNIDAAATPLAEQLAGVPLGSILRYDGYFLAGVVLPGILILRLVWRSTGNWAEDAALGAAVGIAYQLLGLAIFTALGLQDWLVVWPALVVVAFLAVPRLRPYWRIARPAPLPLAWSWGVAIAVGVLVFGVVTGPMLYHLAPSDGSVYNQDMLYHLSMVHELMRSVPPQLPQVAGESLDYHWFANADMAAAADITRLSPELVLFRLWLVPLTVVSVLLTAVLARQVSRQWLAAVVAVQGSQATFTGAAQNGGLTIGILPSDPDGPVSRYVDVAVFTGLGDARNAVNVLPRG